MDPIILKHIAAPSLRLGLSQKAFNRFVMVAVPLVMTRSFILVGILLAGFYAYLLRRSLQNPFFLEEEAARKKYPKTRNLTAVSGNYYCG